MGWPQLAHGGWNRWLCRVAELNFFGVKNDIDSPRHQQCQQIPTGDNITKIKGVIGGVSFSTNYIPSPISAVIVILDY